MILQFRRGLVLRRIGRSEEARELLEVAVPTEVQRWSQAATGLREDQKQVKLREIFLRELGRVEDVFLVYELLNERIEQDLIPAMCNQVAAQVDAVLAQYFTPAQEGGISAVRQEVGEAAGLEEPVPAAKPPRRVPPQISFDDIPGMIDMLLDREYQQRGR